MAWLSDCSIGRLVLVVCLLTGAMTAEASKHEQQYRDLVGWLSSSEQYRPQIDEATGLLLNQAGLPSVATESPGYVLAACESDTNIAQAQQVLKAVLAAQDTQPGSATEGQFPWLAGQRQAPNLQATYFASPVLAQVYIKHAEKLSSELSAQLHSGLELALAAVRGKPAPSEDDVTGLLRAASLAMVGRALGADQQITESLKEVATWLGETLDKGLGDGHSPSSDSYRLAALKWIWQAAGTEMRSDQLRDALVLMYQDLAWRVQANSGALAGAALYAEPGDYLYGGQYSPYLIYVDLGGPRPQMMSPFAMFFVAPDYAPSGDLLAVAGQQLPAQISTEARGEAYIVRTDTYMYDRFSLGTMTGRPSNTSIPLMVTFADCPERPTAYFFTDPWPSYVTSVQVNNVGMITVDFDVIGQGNRLSAWLRGVLGPRSQIDRVIVGGGEWNGLPTAIPAMGTVAVERAGCYVGIRALRAGPAEGRAIVSGPKPAVLEWTDQGDTAELQLTIYARKRSYRLRQPLNNLRAGVVVKVAPASSFDSLVDFAADFARARLRQSVERTKELLPEPTDPFKGVLTEHKPKSKSELEYKHMLLHTISYEDNETSWQVQEDMLNDEVTARSVNGGPVALAGPWQIGQRVLLWRAQGLDEFLTIAP